jgi:hypothetical protein
MVMVMMMMMIHVAAAEDPHHQLPKGLRRGIHIGMMMMMMTSVA